MTDREVMQQVLDAWDDPAGMKDLCVAMDALRKALEQQQAEPVAQRKPLTIAEVEQILAQHNYEIHGDRARYIVRMTEAANNIKEVK